jgi:hypothetical protein
MRRRTAGFSLFRHVVRLRRSGFPGFGSPSSAHRLRASLGTQNQGRCAKRDRRKKLQSNGSSRDGHLPLPHSAEISTSP